MFRIFILFIGVLTVTISFAQETDLFAKISNGNIFIEHVVKSKENWYSLGRKYQLSPKDIAPYNQLSIDKGLSIGQVLKIPLIESNFDQNTNSKSGISVFHKVQPKESLFKIAESYGVTVSALKGWNNYKTDQIKVGDKLIIGFLKKSTKNDDVVDNVPKSKKADSSVLISIDSPLGNGKAANNSTKNSSDSIIMRDSLNPAIATKDTVEKVASAAVIPKSTSKALEKTASGFFYNLYSEQAVSGKEQHLEAFIYGTFKSTSGWDDQKYYILFNGATPGTAVKISIKSTSRAIFAKVLGAIPPGKESQGFTMRMSTATAAALGITDTNVQLALDWYK